VTTLQDIALQHMGEQPVARDSAQSAIEYAKAAHAVEGTGTGDAKVLAATWRETLKVKPNGAQSVLRSMRARLPSLRGTTAREGIKSALTCIDHPHALGRMEYVQAQKRNYSIGTGVTEAAAKTIVGGRMKRAGARFSQDGGQTVMLFQTALLSHRFEGSSATRRFP
jgi:hypothetical protein